MAALVGVLKLVEYKYFVRDIPLEFYIGLVAILFTAIGIWAGLRLTRPKVIDTSGPFVLDENNLQKLGISKRLRSCKKWLLKPENICYALKKN